MLIKGVHVSHRSPIVVHLILYSSTWFQLLPLTKRRRGAVVCCHLNWVAWLMVTLVYLGVQIYVFTLHFFCQDFRLSFNERIVFLAAVLHFEQVHAEFGLDLCWYLWLTGVSVPQVVACPVIVGWCFDPWFLLLVLRWMPIQFSLFLCRHNLYSSIDSHKYAFHIISNEWVYSSIQPVSVCHCHWIDLFLFTARPTQSCLMGTGRLNSPSANRCFIIWIFFLFFIEK